jgi:Tol biopolymer transport system component
MRRAFGWFAVAGVLFTACASASPTPSLRTGSPSATAGRAGTATATSSTPPPSGSLSEAIDVSTLSGTILFTRAGGAYGEDTLFTASANGTNEQQITHTQVARWSPDGSLMSFEHTAADGRRLSVALARPDGTIVRILPLPKTGLNLEAHAWSPDGKAIAFEGWNDGDPSMSGIYLGRSADAGALHRIGLTNDAVGADDFSPDGSKLVFFRPSPDGSGLGSLAIMGVDGSGLQQLTTPADVVHGASGWSPDGRWILTDNVGAIPDGAIWLIGADGSGMREVFKPEPGHFVTTPTWSPDGSMIMFGIDDGPVEDAYDPNGLYVIRADGSGLALVIGGDNFKHGPEWVR